FSGCSGCGLWILTSRDAGTRLRCKSCGTENVLEPAASPALASLLDEVHRRIGREVEPIAGLRLVLLLQPLEPEGEQRAAEACAAMGFTPLPESHPVVANLWFDGVERGILDPERAFSSWEKTAAPGSVAYVGETPPDIEAALLAIGDVTESLSLSTSY